VHHDEAGLVRELDGVADSHGGDDTRFAAEPSPCGEVRADGALQCIAVAGRQDLFPRARADQRRVLGGDLRRHFAL
jgi:hypothetical protein